MKEQTTSYEDRFTALGMFGFHSLAYLCWLDWN